MPRELDAALDLLAVMGDALVAADRPVARLSLVPGGAVVAYDDCCDGMAWVRLTASVPTNAFPAQEVRARNCPPAEWAATYEVGIVRCAASVGDRGEPPTVQAVQLDAVVQWSDLDIMRDACAAFGRDRSAYVLGPYTPVDVQGGCVGGLMTVSVPV